LLKNIQEDFYAINLANTSNLDFFDFLEKINEEVNSVENKKIMDYKEQEIRKILPSYSETTNDIAIDSLTDFKFINYIETILDTFSLKYSNPI